MILWKLYYSWKILGLTILYYQGLVYIESQGVTEYRRDRKFSISANRAGSRPYPWVGEGGYRRKFTE